MTIYYYIQELENYIKKDMEEKGINENDDGPFISYKEHSKIMINMLNILKKEINNVEYAYHVDYLDGKTMLFDDIPVYQQDLNSELIAFSPVSLKDAEVIDMSSLSEIVTNAIKNGIIDKNVILLPPNINILKAVPVGAENLLQEDPNGNMNKS